MTENEERRNCICCNKKQEVLIAVEMKSETFFLQRRGVCQDCLKNKDINDVCREFEIRKTEELIERDEEALSVMREHLNKLKTEVRK